MSQIERLIGTEIRACLGNTVIGREIIVREQTTSTNDELWELACDGAGEGLVLFAEYQTHGRGQRGNAWNSAAYKGLWLSMLLRPNTPVKNPTALAGWAAGAVVVTLRNELQIDAELRVPNDVYIGDHKVAGVLVELRARSGAPHIAIVGVGINVTHQLSDFPENLRGRATSIAMITRSDISRNALAIALLRTFDRLYRSGEFSAAAPPTAVDN